MSTPLFQHPRRSLSSQALKSHYDVVVVGGGMVGLSFAAFAGRHQLHNHSLRLTTNVTK